ncbi:MAG: exodeoxyribonuclease V subunit beta [Methylococcales bacterium]
MNKSSPRLALDIIKTPISGCNLIEASAGTGKTWSITGLYLRMIIENQLLPENILVVTFTKAATAELNARIRTRLYDAQLWLDGDHSLDDKDFFSDLFLQWELLGITENTITDLLTQALAAFDKSAIYTIHSFCQRLLDDYVFEAGTEFNLDPSTDTSEQLETVVNDFWRKHLDEYSDDNGWLKWLIENKQSPEQWLKAVKNYKSKPYQIILEAVENIESTPDLDPQQNSTSSSNNSLFELQQQCKSIWQISSSDILACIKPKEMYIKNYRESDVDSYLAALSNFLSSELTSPLRKLSKGDKIFSQSNLKVKKKFEPPKHEFFELMEQFINEYEYSYTQEAAQFQLRLQQTLAQLLRYIDIHFPRIKAIQGILDFDDMILKVYGALTGANGDVFSQAVASQFNAALIDEFQDTDPLQFKIFSQLFVKTNTPLFYVGDPKQAIYSFRGADIHAYYQAAQEADSQLTLMTNYRSSPKLVDSLNALFSPVDIKSKVQTHRPFISDNICFDWVKSNPKEKFILIADEDSDNACFDHHSAMQFFIAKSEDGKAFSRNKANPMAVEHTVNQIAFLLDKSYQKKAYFESKSGEQRPLGPSDIAVLVPRHIDAADIFKALAQRGISSVRQVQDKVLQSTAALTLLRLIKAVAQPANESCILELLGDPLMAKTAQELYNLKEDPKQWENLLEFFWELKETWLEYGFSAMFRLWLERSGLEKSAQASSLSEQLMSYTEGERYLTDLMHLSEILQEQNRYSKGIQPLITWLQHSIDGNSGGDESQLRLESDSKRVKLVTLHACKGLEYKLVFCPFLWAGKVPREDSIVVAHKEDQALVDFGSEQFNEHTELANEEVLMEQLRLLYVALTRGVHHCYIFWAQVQYGQYIYTANSALAWLLYGDSSMDDNSGVKLRAKVKNLSFDEFVQGVADFCETASSREPLLVVENPLIKNQASVSYKIIDEIGAGTYLNKNAPSSESIGLESSSITVGNLSPSWWQSSFSGLVNGQHASFSEKIDDEVSEFKIEENEKLVDETDFSIFLFPRGASPGLCIHSIFEHWDFKNTNLDELNTLAEKEIKSFAIGKEADRSQWSHILSKNIITTLNTPLNERGFTLAQSKAENRQAEMEFLLSSKSNTLRLKSLLSDQKFQLPQDFIEASKQIDWKEIKGFLIGFIDLIVKDDQGRYYVLDWKSNHLGNETVCYGQKQMERAMAESHYYLQALVYLVALHRYLSTVLPDYDINKHLGGAWYIFVRGIKENSNNGVYHFQPPLELIKALDQELNAGGWVND